MKPGPGNKFLDFFFYGNIFISLCAAILAVEPFLFLQRDILWDYIAFVFFATLCLYNGQRRVLGVSFESSSDRLVWIHKNSGNITGLAVAGAAGAAVFYFRLPVDVVWFLAPASFVAIAYFLPGLSLRSRSALKPFVVAFVWMVITSLIPYEISRGNEMPDFASYNWIRYNGSDVFFFIAALCILFDVRDMESDTAAGVRTVAVQYGLNSSKIFALVTLGMSAFVHFYFGFSPSPLMLLVFLATAGVILLTNKNRGELFYVFIVDGMIIVRALAYWLLS